MQPKNIKILTQFKDINNHKFIPFFIKSANKNCKRKAVASTSFEISP